jgi:hypothetical protein
MDVPKLTTDGDVQMCAASADCPSYKRFTVSDYSTVLFEKMTVPQPLKNFPHSMELKFIAAFKTAPPPAPVLSFTYSIKAPSHPLRICFNTILSI